MPDRKDAILRHALLYLRQLVAANDGYLDGNESMLAALAQFDQEWGNIAAAQERLSKWVDGVDLVAIHSNQNAQALVDFCNAYPDAGAYILSLRLPPAERLAWLNAALKASRLLQNDLTTQAHLGNIGLVHLELGQGPIAIEYFEQASALATKIGDALHQGIWAGNLGNAFAAIGEHEKAIQYHQKHLELARQQADLRSQGHALANLGVSYAALGRYQKTLQVYRQHLELSQQTGDKRDECHALFSLGEAFFDLGQLEDAREYFTRALEISRTLKENTLQALSLGGLADVLIDQGQAVAAIPQLQQALEILQAHPDTAVECRLLASMGNACNAANLLDEALIWHQRLYGLAGETGNQSMRVHAIGSQVSVYRVQGDFARAQELAVEGLSIAEQMSFGAHLAFLSWQLGLMLETEGKFGDALKLMEKTVSYEEQVGSPELNGHLVRMADIRRKAG